MAGPFPAQTMYLPEIVAHVREVVAARKLATPLCDLERQATAHEPRGFARALRAKANVGGGSAVIAELKKASPSKGLIRPDFEPVGLACELEAAGAAALSVLTEERFFQGSLEYLRRVSGVVSLPCLRKDFMIDPYQVAEARAYGADAILLIVASSTDTELRLLRDEARGYQLDVLCEVHSREELERALPLDCECIGVNSRDLRTFDVSVERACELVDLLPRETVRVAESGIHSRADVNRLQAAGYGAFLIGEFLMRQPLPGEALKRLVQ